MSGRLAGLGGVTLVTTLLVLVFATPRLRPPAADGRVSRRGGGG